MSLAHTRSRDEVDVAAAGLGDESALRALVARYRPMINALAAERFLPGGDHDDLVQEGMIGLWHAIRDHDPLKGPFRPFARLCIDRQMWAAVTKANRQRHRVLRDAEVLEDWFDVPDAALGPAQQLQSAESVDRLLRHLRAALTDLEHDVVSLYVAGESYEAIATRLDVHRKRIDNALQRARRKVLAFVDQAEGRVVTAA